MEQKSMKCHSKNNLRSKYKYEKIKRTRSILRS